MDYFIWNFQSRYDVYTDSWRVWTGVKENIPFTEVIENFKIQISNKIFSENFIHRVKKGYRNGMWSFLLFSMEDILIGTARLTKRNHNECELHSLFVDPQFRGNQLGAKLIQKIIEVAKNQGFKVIFLTTFPFWHSAIKLYEEIGFTKCDFIEFGTMDKEYTKETGIIFMKIYLD